MDLIQTNISQTKTVKEYFNINSKKFEAMENLTKTTNYLVERLKEREIDFTIESKDYETYIYSEFGIIRISDYPDNRYNSITKIEIGTMCDTSEADFIIDKVLEKQLNRLTSQSRFKKGDLVTNNFVDFEVVGKLKNGKLKLKDIKRGNTLESFPEVFEKIISPRIEG